MKESGFNVSLQNEIDKLIKLVSKPGNFELSKCIKLHESIETQLNEYINSSSLMIKNEIKNELNEYIKQFRDIKKVQQDLKKEIKLESNVKVPKLKLKIKNYTPTMFDSCVYYELAENIITDKDLPKSEIAEIVNNYNEISNEIISQLSNLPNEISQFESYMITLKNETLKKAYNNAEILYNLHLSYLKNKHNFNVTFNGIQYNSLPKQSEFLTTSAILGF